MCFRTNVGEISVTIAGAACAVQTVTDTEITCRTGSTTSGITQVEVQRNGWGLATQVYKINVCWLGYPFATFS